MARFNHMQHHVTFLSLNPLIQQILVYSVKSIHDMYIRYLMRWFVRTLVDIPDNEVEALASICAEEKVSRAEIIRRAIRDYIAKNSPETIDAFGLWKEESESSDGMEYQEKIRGEW